MRKLDLRSQADKSSRQEYSSTQTQQKGRVHREKDVVIMVPLRTLMRMQLVPLVAAANGMMSE